MTGLYFGSFTLYLRLLYAISSNIYVQADLSYDASSADRP